MKQQIIGAGQGRDYAWSKDHIFVKTTLDLTDGRVTVVEDRLNPGFYLPRHCHKEMTEIFYVLDGEIEFKFDDETVIATSGMTINIPPNIWHDVKSDSGGRLITIFSPGGFEKYLEEMASLAEKYDTWMRYFFVKHAARIRIASRAKPSYRQEITR